jgi:hypothetical protein
MEPVTVLAIMGLATIGGGAFLTAWSRRIRHRMLMKDRCLACDGDKLELRDQDDRYRCTECGYDSGWASQPRFRRRVEALQAMGWALIELRAARTFISMTPPRSPQLASLVGRRSSAEDNYLEATSRSMAALEVLEPWMNDHPSLASLPFMGDDDGTGMVQKFLGPSHTRARDGLDETIETVEAVRLGVCARMVREARDAT